MRHQVEKFRRRRGQGWSIALLILASIGHQHGLAHDLVGDPVSFAAKQVKPVADVAAELAAAGINSVVVLDSVYSQTAKLVDGQLTPEDFDPKDNDPHSVRTLKAFMRALRERIVACHGRVAAHLSGGQIITAEKIYVWGGVSPEHLFAGQSEEARGWGKSYRFTYTIRFSDVLVRSGDGILNSFSWVPAAPNSTFEWSFSATIRMRPSALEAETPKPGSLLIEDGLPFAKVTCGDVPRTSSGVKLLQTASFATAEERPVFFERKADKGDPDAAFLFGQLLLDGIGIKKDAARGITYLKKASAAGVGEASWQLALRYLQGVDVPKDEGEAVLYLKRAEEDPNFAVRALLKLVQLQSQQRLNNVQREQLQNDITPLAAQIFDGLRQNPASPDLNLAFALVLGAAPFPERNANKAVDYLEAARQRGSFKAAVLLGRCYFFGHTVPASWQNAKSAYADALRLAPPQFGGMEGVELSQCLLEARHFTEMAAKHDDDLMEDDLDPLREAFLERLPFALELPFAAHDQKR